VENILLNGDDLYGDTPDLDDVASRTDARHVRLFSRIVAGKYEKILTAQQQRS